MKSVMLRREEINRKVILPLFGSHIRVKETDTDLVVSGIQWHGEPRPMRLPAYDDLADQECRVVDLLSGYDEDRRLSQTERSKALHFLFANAGTLLKQKEFVRTFGPVLASKIDRTTSRPGLPTMTAYQDIEALRFEQQLYSLIFDLTSLVNDLIPFSGSAQETVRPPDLAGFSRDGHQAARSDVCNKIGLKAMARGVCWRFRAQVKGRTGIAGCARPKG